ncbi:MAG: FAD:protein FMN transferase [Acidobacteriota bacterium]
MKRSAALMGTIITIHVDDADDGPTDGARGSDQRIRERQEAVERAFGWFREVEACCSRFDADSELMQLVARPGVPVRASRTLLHAVRLALAVAEETGGAFDPTVGAEVASRGFDRHYRTGQRPRLPIVPDDRATYRDVAVDLDAETITLGCPLLLDLGAVAKGLAIDLAARELRVWKNYAVDAGGDLYVAGRGPGGGPWSVGIRHPRDDHRLIETLSASDCAVCTSGDYERMGANAQGESGHHILDPRTGATAVRAASVTVVASTAMLADALATAAFVLGPPEGIHLLERHGVDGLIVAPNLERYVTQGFLGPGSTLRPHAQRPADHRPRAAGGPGRIRRAPGAAGPGPAGRRARRGAR